jgi:hypothetical protein
MADLDFYRTDDEGFTISLGDSPKKVYGNRALVNRFEIVFLTTSRRYLLGGDRVVIDGFAGDAEKYINKPQALNDLQGIATSVSTAIDKTVKAILEDQPDSVPMTERLDSAELMSIDIVEGVVVAVIKINPVEVEFYDSLTFNFPIKTV